MSETELKTKLEEPEVIDILLRRKVVSEAQLKAALDFQKAVGGSVIDVLFKLGLVRSTDVEAVLKDPDGPAEEPDSDTKESNQVLDPEEIDVGELKLHHRLLDKVPREYLQDAQPGGRVEIQGRLMTRNLIQAERVKVLDRKKARRVEGTLIELPPAGLLGKWTVQTPSGETSFVVESLAAVDTSVAPAGVGMHVRAVVRSGHRDAGALRGGLDGGPARAAGTGRGQRADRALGQDRGPEGGGQQRDWPGPLARRGFGAEFEPPKDEQSGCGAGTEQDVDLRAPRLMYEAETAQ